MGRGKVTCKFGYCQTVVVIVYPSNAWFVLFAMLTGSPKAGVTHDGLSVVNVDARDVRSLFATDRA